MHVEWHTKRHVYFQMRKLLSVFISAVFVLLLIKILLPKNKCLFIYLYFICLFIYLSNGSFHLLFSFYSCLSPAPSGNTYLVGDLAEATTWLAEQSIWIWAGLEDSAIRAVWETRLVYRRGLNASLARSVMIEAFVGVEISTTLDTSMTTWIIVIAQRITGSVIVCSLSAGNRDKKACVSQTFKEWIG